MFIPDRLVQWLAGGERGISSNTIVAHLTGLPALGTWHRDHPHDPADMGRCRRLLEDVPELQADFPRMASCSPVWAALVERWQELCDMMDKEAPRWRDGIGSAHQTYDRMRELIDAARPRPAGRQER